MNLRVLIIALALLPGLLRAETEISAPESGSERQETTSELEWEAKGVIPEGGLTVSTQPVTPKLAGIAPGNHDMAFTGNFFCSPYWTGACKSSVVSLVPPPKLSNFHDHATWRSLKLSRLIRSTDE